MKILIAEDDATSREILAHVLRQLGHEVQETANGEEAWAVFQREHVSFLISDWMMPGLDGLQLCRRIRAEQRPRYTYIVLLTVLGGKQNYLEAMEAGTDDFISKPFDVDQLHARLRVAERILGLQTELREVELTREQVVRRERLRALGEMASGIVHDFTNAMSAVVGFSSMLLLRPGDLDDRTRVRHCLEMIYAAGEGASQLVRRLREFYRPRDEVEVFMAVNVNELVAMAVALTRPRWRAQAQASGGGVTVHTELGEIRAVDGNATALRDVLTNLIFNAVDAMPRGGTLTIQTGLDDPRSAVTLRVTDTGVGMTDDVRRRCLEPFFTTKGDRGTGLGLAMAYGVIQRHGGTIDIESQPGRGSTFLIRLPVRTEPVAPVSVMGEEPASRPLRVLVVDDEPVPLEVAVELLVGDGHMVEAATNGREALQRFQTGWFDVILTDWAMPEMNGLELAFNIKRFAPQKPVIIMLTGFGEISRDPGDRPPDVDLVIGKPITLPALRDALAIVK
jgi:signal transduction histidine kinase